jgi:hypothetical protein
MNNTCVFQWSALLPVVLTLIATQQKDTILADLCYTKWALEAFVIANAQKYSWLTSAHQACPCLLQQPDKTQHFSALPLPLVAAIPACGS